MGSRQARGWRGGTLESLVTEPPPALEITAPVVGQVCRLLRKMPRPAAGPTAACVRSRK